jgi:hypothetical protein
MALPHKSPRFERDHLSPLSHAKPERAKPKHLSQKSANFPFVTEPRMNWIAGAN